MKWRTKKLSNLKKFGFSREENRIVIEYTTADDKSEEIVLTNVSEFGFDYRSNDEVEISYLQ